MKSKIILVGKAGAGKDFLKQKFVEKGYCPSISTTTRPPRKGEIDGVDYDFVSEETFREMEFHGLFYETDWFNGWGYGTPLEAWRNGEIFIMTPAGVAAIPEADRERCLVIYLDIPKKVRYNRLSQRSDVDKVERRIAADEKDFAGFNDYDVRISNPDF